MRAQPLGDRQVVARGREQLWCGEQRTQLRGVQRRMPASG
jgi:hypothetical protein